MIIDDATAIADIDEGQLISARNALVDGFPDNLLAVDEILETLSDLGLSSKFSAICDNAQYGILLVDLLRALENLQTDVRSALTLAFQIQHIRDLAAATTIPPATSYD